MKKKRMNELIYVEQLDENGEHEEVVPQTFTKHKHYSWKAKDKGKKKVVDDGLGLGDDSSNFLNNNGDETVSTDSENGVEITNDKVCDLPDNSESLLSNVYFSSLTAYLLRWLMKCSKERRWSAAKHLDQSVKTGVLRHTSYTTYKFNECA